MITDALRVFVTVAEQRHFSKAAELLNLSQPGVSLHIKNLENELGTRLLHRSPKQVRLTEAGDILYKHAKVMLSRYEDAQREIQMLRDEVTGSVQVGASFTIGEYILPQRLAAFAAQYPQVNIQVTIGNSQEILAAVRENQWDLGFVEGEVPPSADLEVIPYMKDEMIVVSAPSHPLTRFVVVEKELLQNQVWVLRESGSGTRAFSDRFMEAAEIQPKVTHVLSSSQGVKEAVSAGLGIAMLSRWTVRKELAAGEMHELRIRQPVLERSFSIIRHEEHSRSMAAQVFLEKLLFGNSNAKD